MVPDCSPSPSPPMPGLPDLHTAQGPYVSSGPSLAKIIGWLVLGPSVATLLMLLRKNGCTAHLRRMLAIPGRGAPPPGGPVGPNRMADLRHSASEVMMFRLY